MSPNKDANSTFTALRGESTSNTRIFAFVWLSSFGRAADSAACCSAPNVEKLVQNNAVQTSSLHANATSDA
eukprot:2028161-Lingulodinium_polyedra.AAC.1